MQDTEGMGSGKARPGEEEQQREVHHSSQRSLRTRGSMDVVRFQLLFYIYILRV
jgi:hypothetical protein